MIRWFGQTLHRRMVAMAVMVCVVAIGAAAVLVDARYSRVVFDDAAREANRLLDRLQGPEARIRRDTRRDGRGLQVRLRPPLRSAFRFDDGVAAFITLGDEVLWQSDERLGKPSSSEPPVQGRWEGVETISYAGRAHEAYLIRTTETREWPGPVIASAILTLEEEGHSDMSTAARAAPSPADTAGLSGEERPPETYALTYHVALDTEPYRREIMTFRTEMAAIVAVAMAVFGAAMYVVVLRPLARITRRVSELEAWSGQRIQGHDGDPEEIRTLTERFNDYLQKLDDTGGWEKACHGRLRAVLQVAEKELSPESEINQRGFMHSLSHLLSAIPLTEFKTIPDEEKEAVHKDFMRVRSMIERRLHDLVTSEAGDAARSAEVVEVAREFFARSTHGGESFLQSFMRRRHPDRSFDHLQFELRHEHPRLHARIDKSYLYELMFNLLHNAAKAADAQVRMTIARWGGMVRMVVENDGKRFPPAERENLVIGRDSTGGEGEGHGIGLPYVRRIARDHDGDLALEDSDDLGGARAVLELPLAEGGAAMRGADGDAAPRAVPT